MNYRLRLFAVNADALRYPIVLIFGLLKPGIGAYETLRNVLDLVRRNGMAIYAGTSWDYCL